MDNLKVEFRFYGDLVIFYTADGDPVYGDVLEVIVNEQRFRKTFKVSEIDKTIDYQRERAKLFGEALQQIGYEIEMQAERGKPEKRTYNEQEWVWF